MGNIYGGKDPRNIPAYSIGDAANYLKIPQSTVRSWVRGYPYKVKDGSNFFYPLVDIPNSDRKPYLLSFTNLVEVHVLRAIRHHQVQLNKIREALDFIGEQFEVSHPLAQEKFQTNGVDLFIQRYGELINASSSGKQKLKDSFDAHLKRIEPDNSGLAIELYPFTRTHEDDNPRVLVIDPRIAFGRLTIAETGIAVDVIKGRFNAGDSVNKLAEDYDCDRILIEEAIRSKSYAA